MRNETEMQMQHKSKTKAVKLKVKSNTILKLIKQFKAADQSYVKSCKTNYLNFLECKFHVLVIFIFLGLQVSKVQKYATKFNCVSTM
jgi:hypothetical protein